jgi:hypothetical protein
MRSGIAPPVTSLMHPAMAPWPTTACDGACHAPRSSKSFGNILFDLSCGPVVRARFALPRTTVREPERNLDSAAVDRVIGAEVACQP